MSTEFSTTRRSILASGAASVVAAIGAACMPWRAASAKQQDSEAALPHLSPDDPVAKSLKYVNDAANAGPARTDGAACHSCRFFKGKGTTGWGPCQIFPNNTVNAQGWCSVWMMKDQ